MTTAQALSAVIIVLVYVGIAVGQVPYLRMNRATIALVGAVALVLVGAITEEQAFDALDMGTILLLGAMMVLNVNLRLAGFFDLVGNRALRVARSPRMLLAMVVLSSGLLSAIFLNDPICIMMTPIVVNITRRLQRNPIPYLIGLATAANVGSVATITGNPQNLVIGQLSHIPYLTFLGYLAPVAIIGLIITWAVILVLYRAEFTTPLITTASMPEPRPYPPLLNRVLLVVLVLMLAFLLGAPIVTAACVAAGLLLISRLRPQKLLDIDWELLAFFTGLFVVTGAIETTGLSELLFEAVRPVLQSGTAVFSLIIGALSNLVSNVPAVLLLRPEIPAFPNPEQAWITLAMASTLAGNLTLLGSAASLIVAESAGVRGAKLSFTAFLRAGIPITVLTLLVGIVWLTLIFGR